MFDKFKKRQLSKKWIERANYHDQLSERLEEDGDEYASDIAKIIADVFRLCAAELNKL